MKKEIKEQLMQSELFRNETMISDATDCILPGYIHHVGDTYWGKSLYVMEERGIALVCVSWYEDDQPDTAFIEGLSVSFKYRELGYGSSLMDMAENVCRALERRYAILGVVRGSWQEQWYRRRGYKDCERRHEDKELIMLRKDLNG